VFRGKWKQSRVVAKTVKLRSEEDRAAFLNEVVVWHKLFNPHVVQLFGACHIQQPFFVCEYAGGGQLDHSLPERPPQGGVAQAVRSRARSALPPREAGRARGPQVQQHPDR